MTDVTPPATAKEKAAAPPPRPDFNKIRFNPHEGLQVVLPQKVVQGYEGDPASDVRSRR